VEDRGRNDVLLIIGVVVLVVGLGALARTLGIVPPLVWQALGLLARAAGPLALIVLGVIVIIVATRGGLRPTLPSAGVRVYRSRRDRIIAGVAGGIAQYFDVDPLLVRLAFVFLGLASFGTALVLYIVLAVLMPEAPAEGVQPDA
jgi:phage shock protein C